MVPTCLLSDIIVAASAIVPSQIVFPAPLLCEPNQTTTPTNQTCLKSCTSIGFNDSSYPVAFAVCDLSPAWCAGLLATSGTGVVWLDQALAPLASSMRPALLAANQTLADASLVPAARLCTLVAWATTLPWIALIIALLCSESLSALLLVTLEITQASTGVAVQALVYSRTPDKI